MSTALRLGPRDHGRRMSYDEFMAGDYEEGFKYEIIAGRLYVSPLPRFAHDWIEKYIYHRLNEYAAARPEVINKVIDKSRVFVPDPSPHEVTAPEPDISAYRDFPQQRRSRVNWRDVSPILVVEVLAGEDDEKDLVRNPDLYLRVPSIQEYWLFDIREDAERPKLKVHRRDADAWEITDFDSTAVYCTDLLPGFELPVTPPAEYT